MFKSLKLKIHHYSEFLDSHDFENAERVSSEASLEALKEYRLDGMAIGEQTTAAVLRYYARGTFQEEKKANQVMRRYFKAALLTAYATQKLIRQIRFDSTILHTGIYVPQGIIGEICRKEGLRVVNWDPGYKSKRFIFAHRDSQHHVLVNEPVVNWENIEWTYKTDRELTDYLKSRWEGTQDWISYQRDTMVDVKKISQEVGVDFSKPCIGMLTNVFWDAQLFYPSNAFSNMMEWVFETIRFFETKPNLQLIIRVHPGEVRSSHVSREPVVECIRKAFPKLPANVFIIPPESRVSTYAMVSRCNAVLIYGTTAGVEIAAMGIPVIVVGEAWLRNKRISFDVSSKEEYYGLLRSLPFEKPMEKDRLLRARKYAYHLYFRRMIPLDFMEPEAGNPPYSIQISGLDDLKPGHDRGLDIICDGIMKGSEFIFPQESILHRGRFEV